MRAVPPRLSPLVRRVRAANPSAMTGAGTNTYLVGLEEMVVIDPGPDDPDHIEHIVDALGGARLLWILVTHTHPDHALGAPRLARQVGAEVRAPATDKTPTAGAAGRANHALIDGQAEEGKGFTLEAIHTPGHASDHFSFLLREESALFSGDLIMSGSTVVIAPPDGDMTAYMRSLERVQVLRIARIYPGHGDPIDAPKGVIDEYIRHRQMRERQILEALRDGPRRIDDLVASIYAEAPRGLHRMAALSVYAHLLKLRAEGQVKGSDRYAAWALVER
jgi:glyoxylase-like metal-dependent hydrolase (beta-lactamase superfamily II)